MFPWVSEMRRADPGWWAAHQNEAPILAVRAFFERNPTHPMASDPFFADAVPKRAP